ncbi:MAG TPA: hypothetical protein VGF67_05115 [Ktedonobacteraceae bacterium]|jgi:N-acyl-D-aspartate/D-glutamate deacylase
MERYDLVLRNGRVMDPKTGRDLIEHVGITDGKITTTGTEHMSGLRYAQ